MLDKGIYSTPNTCIFFLLFTHTISALQVKTFNFMMYDHNAFSYPQSFTSKQNVFKHQMINDPKTSMYTLLSEEE